MKMQVQTINEKNREMNIENDTVMVKIRDLTKRYNGNIAVDNISLDIKEGEIYGLLGPNGAGKSTTINIILGLISMDKGSIKVMGKDVKKSSFEVRSNIGIVPQDIAIYEDLTALENVMFFASLYGVQGSVLKELAQEALDFTGLSDKTKNFPKTFSGGMKRRLNIACAIAHNPKIIIMDEPTVGIDPQSRNHILQSVRTLNEKGCTVIYTSHYMEEVESLCSRIAIMDHGKIIAEGTKEDLTALITDRKTVTITLANMLNDSNIKKIKEIKDIYGVIGVDINDDTVTITSEMDTNNLDKIILFLTSNRIHIRNVESKMPDLETVFLTLTGRKLRD